MRSPAHLVAWALLAAPAALANPEQPPQPTQLDRRGAGAPFQRPRRLGFAAAGPGAQGTKRARGFGKHAADDSQLARRQILDAADQGLDNLTGTLFGSATLAPDATKSDNSTSAERSSTSATASRSRSILPGPTVTALAANGTADGETSSTSRSSARSTAASSSGTLDESSVGTTGAPSITRTSEAAGTASSSSSSVRNLRDIASSIRAAQVASASAAAAEAAASDSSLASSSTSTSSASAGAPSSTGGILNLSGATSSDSTSSASSSSSAAEPNSSSLPSPTESSSTKSSATVTWVPVIASNAPVSSESATTRGSYGGILSQLGDIFGPKSSTAEPSSTVASSTESSTVAASTESPTVALSSDSPTVATSTKSSTVVSSDESSTVAASTESSTVATSAESSSAGEAAVLTSIAPPSSTTVNRAPFNQLPSRRPSASVAAPTLDTTTSELPLTVTTESDVPLSSSSPVPAPSVTASETDDRSSLTGAIPGLAPTSTATDLTGAPAAVETEPAVANSTVPIAATSTIVPVVGIPTGALNQTASSPPGTASSLPETASSPSESSVLTGSVPIPSHTSSTEAVSSSALNEPTVPRPNATATATQRETESTALPAGVGNATAPVTRPTTSIPLTTSAGPSSHPVNGTAAASGTSDASAPSVSRNATISHTAGIPGVSPNTTLSSEPIASVTGSPNATSSVLSSASISSTSAQNATTTERPRSSSAAQTSSAVPTSTTVNTEYEWVPTSTLMVAQPKTTTSSSTLSSISDSSSGSLTTAAPDSSALQQGASTSMVDGKPSITITSQVSFPTNLPSRIVPADESTAEDLSDGGKSTAVSQAAADTVPTTTISILLDDSMPWEWVVENSDASGQIFFYVPIVVTAALNVSLDTLKTIALQAYQTTNSQGESDILTVFLGAIPTTYVDALSAMIKTPSSPIYQQQGLPGQLAQTFVSSFAVTSFASESALMGESGTGTSSSDASSATRTSKSDGSGKSKTIIIAVVVTCGVLLIALAAYFAFRATKSGAVALSTSPRLGDRDFRDRDMAQHPSGGLRGFYLNSAPGSPYRQRSGSISTTSTASTGISSGDEYAPRFGSPRAGAGASPRHGASSSVDDRRSSWWRFSDSSSGPGAGGVGLAIGGTDTYREGPRRIQIHRGPDGAVAPGMIGRPVVQSNSLML
ncbi:hypothetical protein JCM3770_000818 [Rhodotorula araucariae]